MGNTAGGYNLTGRRGSQGPARLPAVELRAHPKWEGSGRPAGLAGVPAGYPETEAQAKVAEATMAPAELTSFAPRSRPMSTWMFREN